MTATAERKQLLHQATVTRQTSYGEGYFVLELACPALAAAIDIGQFVNVRIRGEHTPLLRRPFSVFDVLTDAAGKPTGISLLYHVVGAGTALMSKYTQGTVVSLNGPLGNVFPLAGDQGTATTPGSPVIMVGGGIGLAPFLLMAKRWPGSAMKGRNMMLIAGGRSERDLRYMNLFAPAVKQGVNLLLCTEDGSAGVKGRATLPLRGELEAAAKKGVTPVVYCCGPTPMMSAVAAMCGEFAAPCIVSLESVMACGYGVCNGCVTPVRDVSAEGGSKYLKTCTYGPAFDGAAVLW